MGMEPGPGFRRKTITGGLGKQDHTIALSSRDLITESHPVVGNPEHDLQGFTLAVGQYHSPFMGLVCVKYLFPGRNIKLLTDYFDLRYLLYP